MFLTRDNAKLFQTKHFRSGDRSRGALRPWQLDQRNKNCEKNSLQSHNSASLVGWAFGETHQEVVDVNGEGTDQMKD